MQPVQQVQPARQTQQAASATPRNQQGSGSLESFGNSVTDGRFVVTATRSGAQVSDTQTGETSNVSRADRGRFGADLRVEVARNGTVNVINGADQATLAPAPAPPAADIPPADGSATPILAPENQPIAVPDVAPESFIGQLYAAGDFVDDSGINQSIFANLIREAFGFEKSEAFDGEASTYVTADGLLSLNFEDSVPDFLKGVVIAAADKWERALDPPEGQEPIYVEIGVTNFPEGGPLAAAFTLPENRGLLPGVFNAIAESGAQAELEELAADLDEQFPNPGYGFIHFNEATVQNSEVLFDIALHELAHTLGFSDSTFGALDPGVIQPSEGEAVVLEDPTLDDFLDFANRQGDLQGSADFVFAPESGGSDLVEIANDILTDDFDLPDDRGGLPVAVDIETLEPDEDHLNEFNFSVELLTPIVDLATVGDTRRSTALTSIGLAAMELLGYTVNFDEAEDELAAQLDPLRFEAPEG